MSNNIVTESLYWFIPVKSEISLGNEKLNIDSLLSEKKLFGLSVKRSQMKQNDWVCFYAGENRSGVIASARLESDPSFDPKRISPIFPWAFSLKNVQLLSDTPIKFDKKLRNDLDAFKGRDLETRWSWFVQTVHRVSKHDFELLTRNRA